jgi:hypothetical protein
LRELKGRAERAGKNRGSDEAPVVVIYIVAKPAVSSSVLPYHAFEIDGRCIREDDAVPDDLEAVLPVGDMGIINPDQA